MSFRLSIVNAPVGSYWWKGSYNDRDVESEWIRVEYPWHCPYDANGATDLRILVYSQDFWTQFHQKHNLGPIYDDKEYTYDCATEQLTEGPYVPAVAVLSLREQPYWNGVSWVDDPPDVEAGGELGVRTIAENVSGETRYVGIRTNVIDPYGVSTEHIISSPSLAPGGSLGSYVKWPVGIPGIWTATIRLCLSPTYPYDVIQTIGPIPVGNVTGVLPPISGYLFGPQVYDATTGENFFLSDLPVGIDGGHKVLAVVYWKNDGSEAVVFTTTLELVDPDGVVRASYTDTRPLDPGQGNGCQTPDVTLDKEGTWKIYAALEASGTLLSEETWDAIQAGVSPTGFQGTITRKELDYDAVRLPVPVSDVPAGVSGSVLIGGTNNTAVNQKMGASWKVMDPDGVEVDSYEDWEMFWTGPGLEQGFVGNRFSLGKVGTYILEVDLLMNYDSPVVVDRYTGYLCTTGSIIPPQFELIHQTVHHFAYIYDGDVEAITATFKTDPFTPSAWAGEKFAATLEEEYRAKGGNVLETKVYVDVTPLLWTDYIVELIGTPLEEEAGAASVVVPALGPVVILIIVAALAIIAIIVVTYVFIIEPLTYSHKVGLEDVKPAWGKDALILDIQDAEAHWGRTPTPIETLEGMSEEELRDILDQIAEEEVPPETPSTIAQILPLMVIVLMMSIMMPMMEEGLGEGFSS